MRNVRNVEINQDNSNSRKRNRTNVLFFNPPFNLYNGTNVGRIFRDLVQKHFSNGNDLGRLFNKNKLKISYRCLPNLKSKISSHNRQILFGDSEINIQGGCNCHNKMSCPMEGNCNVSNVIYEAEVLKEGDNRGSGHFYVGMASGKFKSRYHNHTKSFRAEGYQITELSKFVWQMNIKKT